jgi:RHS repeat-associated protein
VLVDNQFKYVQGGVVQVLSGSSKMALAPSLQTMSKNGYVYVYVSNESPQDVYFDDVTVKHYTGALVQEQSYYPFGVQMMAISDKALKKDGTPYKYNAGSEMEDELEYYNTFYRKYDAQIGRFTGVDILSESTFGLSPFHFGNNNPIFYNDPTGAKSARTNGRMEKGPDGNYHVGWDAEMLWNNLGFFDMDISADDGGGGGGYTSFGGVSSYSVINQMRFGDRVGRNSKGIMGVWQKYAYSVNNGQAPQGVANSTRIDEVRLGSSWVSFSPSDGQLVLC